MRKISEAECRDSRIDLDLLRPSREGDINSLRLTLERNNNGYTVHTKCYFGNTCLHAAAEGNQVEIASFLLERGANIDSLNKDKFTPLHFAYIHKNNEMIIFLISHGANQNLKDKSVKKPKDRENYVFVSSLTENQKELTSLLQVYGIISLKLYSDLVPHHLKSEWDIALKKYEEKIEKTKLRSENRKQKSKKISEIDSDFDN